MSKIEFRRVSKSSIVPLLVAMALLAGLWAAGAVTAYSPASPSTPDSTPAMLNYQGIVRVSDAPMDGTGYFKFAIVDAPTGNGATNYWANDGTGSGEPAAPISLAVSDGLFNVLLGDTSMTGMTQTISEAVFANDPTYLRVWFSATGTPGTYEALEPNQRLVSVPYALHAKYAESAGSAPGPSFSVSKEYALQSWGGGTKSLNLVSTTDSICFLTYVGITDFVSGEPYNSCKITTSGSTWVLEAYTSSSYSERTECVARCLKW